MTTNTAENREITGTRSPGRPPKAPEDKIGRPVRCLITESIFRVLIGEGEAHEISQSDYLRLALFHELEREGKMTDELRQDGTWDALRHAGLI